MLASCPQSFVLLSLRENPTRQPPGFCVKQSFTMQTTLGSSVAIVAAIASLSLASPASPRAPSRRHVSTPFVDLGYEVHTGTVNVSCHLTQPWLLKALTD